MFIAIILTLSFLVKIPFLGAPLVGYFGSYQCVNAMMSEMMAEKGWQAVFAPQINILLSGEPAYHLLYFPFGSFFAFVMNQIAGPIDFWGRFQSAFFMAASGYLLYLIVQRIADKKTALIAALLFSFFPMNLVMGINFQNESIAIFLLLLSFYFNLTKKTILSGLMLSLAMVARIHIILIGPAFIASYLLEKRPLKDYVIFGLSSFIALITWYAYQYQIGLHHTEYVMTSLFNQAGDGRILKHPLLGQSAFYLRVADYILFRSMTPVVIPFALITLFRLRKNFAVWAVWAVGALSCIFLLPQKTNDHPFYLITLLPPMAVMAAVTIRKMLINKRKALFFLTAVFFLFSLRYYIPPAWSSWNPTAVRIKAIGLNIRALTLSEDFIAASHMTSPELLFYTGRKGWPFDIRMDEREFDNRVYLNTVRKKGYGDLIKWVEYLKSQNAKYLVISELDVLNNKQYFKEYLQKNYREKLNQELNYAIYDLQSETT